MVFCQLTGKDGNAFSVMGRVVESLIRADVDEKGIREYMAKAMSGDYDNLLAVSMQTLESYGIEYE